MPIALTPDQLALAAAIRDWAKQAAPLAAVRRLEPGAPAADQNPYAADLTHLGVFSIAIPEELGGAGGTLTDLAVALEQLAIALVPGPLLPTALAGLLLAAAGATAPLPALAGGQATAAVALTADPLSATRQPGGTLRVTGHAGPVLGAGRCARSPAARCSTRSSWTRCSSRTTACSGPPATAGGSPCPRWPPSGWPAAAARTRP